MSSSSIKIPRSSKDVVKETVTRKEYVQKLQTLQEEKDSHDRFFSYLEEARERLERAIINSFSSEVINSLNLSFVDGEYTRARTDIKAVAKGDFLGLPFTFHLNLLGDLILKVETNEYNFKISKKNPEFLEMEYLKALQKHGDSSPLLEGTS